MKKYFEKWYISLFILTILLTYLTSFIQLPDVISNWKYSIITSLLILVIILIYEIQILNKKVERLELKPTEKDKKIIKGLLKTLNLKMFQEDICTQDSWNGYPSEAIHRVIKFQHKSVLIENKTSVKELNNLISDFLKELDAFTEYSHKRVSGKGEWLVPFKDLPHIHPREKIKKETEIMNSLSKKAFQKLENLMFYLRTNDYL